jgi:hypothetical protein
MEQARKARKEREKNNRNINREAGRFGLASHL